MLLAAIDQDHGQRLVAAVDPAERIAIARNAIAHAPLPPLPLADPVVANLLVIFLSGIDFNLANALIGHPIVGASDDFPLRAVAPSEAHRLAAQLATLTTADLEDFLHRFAADPPPDEPTCRAVHDLFTAVRTLYDAAANRHLGLLAVPD